jgi:hypothetical protein
MVEITGISDNLINDERLKVYIDVTVSAGTFKWFVLVPPDQDLQTYIFDNEISITADVQKKVDSWEEGGKDIIIVPNNPMMGGTETVERKITIYDYVQPDYPDYWVHRKLAYPPIGQQLDAMWKGGQDAAMMEALIKAIKEKYPKPEHP